AEHGQERAGSHPGQHTTWPRNAVPTPVAADAVGAADIAGGNRRRALRDSALANHPNAETAAGEHRSLGGTPPFPAGRPVGGPAGGATSAGLRRTEAGGP